MKNRKSLSAVVVVAFAFGTAALSASSAGASTGGGCGPVEGNVAACISASGSHVEPDLYITGVPAGCVDVVFELIDDSTGAVPISKVVSCTAGHFGPWAFAGVNGHYYKAFAQMSTRSGALPSSTSPTEHLAY